MNRYYRSGCGLLFLLIGLLISAFPAVGQTPTVVIIPIAGEIDPAISAFLKRSLKQAETHANAVVILEIDTFGGRVDSALDMVDTLVNFTQHKTVAFVKTKAISAGSLIALACNELVMRNNTTIGDCAPITYSGDGPKELGEKFQSPLRAQFRTLAKRNGYSEVLAESMVTQGMEVLEIVINGRKRYVDRIEFENLSNEEKAGITSQKVIVSKDELLTMDDTEARALGFSKMSVSSIEDMLARMNLPGAGVHWIEKSWSEVLVGVVGTIAPILMLIGIGAIYMEIKSPGFGVPGIVGILCLGLVFLNQYLVGLANYTEMLLLFAGIVLLGFEIFVIPGFGVTGISGLLLITLGLVLAMQDFVIPNPEMPWQKEIFSHNILHVVGALIAGFIFSLLMLRYVFPRISKVVAGPYLETTLKDARVESRDTQVVKAGDRGIALSLLRPAGKMKVGVNVVDVITQGEYIQKGTEVVVNEISGTRIIVVKAEPHEH